MSGGVLEIPVIDFAPFLGGSESERQSVAAKMRQASQEWGFFYLSGCGMPDEALERAFAASKS